MNLFDVYSLWEIEPVRGKGCHVWDGEEPNISIFTADTP